MSERFVRVGIEIPLSLYSNLDKIKNGSAASNRILEAVKKEKEYIDNSKFARVDTYEESVYAKSYCRSDIYSVMDKIKTDSVYGEMDSLYDEKMGFKRNHKENNHEDQETT